MKRYKRAIAITIFTFLLFSTNSAFAANPADKDALEGSGPIGIRNQMPLYLFYLQMIPDKARVTERNKFRIDADYTVSNITASAFTPKTSLYDIQLDMEVSRITLDLRYGLYDNLEIGLEVPYIGLSSGYLDNAIEGIEDGIGARTPRSRENQGSYEFDYSVKYNGAFLIEQKDSSVGIGDMVLNVKYQLLKERSWFLPNLSVRTALKFPTAKKENLLGSGEWDYGFGILMDKSFFNRLFLYAGGNVIRIEKPSFFSVWGLKEEIFSSMLALEYFLTKRLSFVSQVSANTTPYPHSDTNVLDNDAFELGIGFNYTWEKKSNMLWHFALTENLTSASSPDVGIHTGVRWKF